MVDVNAALGQHFFYIPQAEIVRQIPAYTQQDHQTVEWRPENMNSLVN